MKANHRFLYEGALEVDEALESDQNDEEVPPFRPASNDHEASTLTKTLSTYLMTSSVDGSLPMVRSVDHGCCMSLHRNENLKMGSVVVKCEI